MDRYLFSSLIITLFPTFTSTFLPSSPSAPRSNELPNDTTSLERKGRTDVVLASTPADTGSASGRTEPSATTTTSAIDSVAGLFRFTIAPEEHSRAAIAQIKDSGAKTLKHASEGNVGVASVAQDASKQQKQGDPILEAQNNVVSTETVVASSADDVVTAGLPASPRSVHASTRQTAVPQPPTFAPSRRELSLSTSSAHEQTQSAGSSRRQHPLATTSSSSASLSGPGHVTFYMHSCAIAVVVSVSVAWPQQRAAAQDAQPQPNMFFNDMSQMHQMLIQARAAQEELCRRDSIIQNRDSVIKSQEKYIQRAEKSRHDLVAALKTRVVTLEHELGMKADTAVSLLSEKEELETLLGKESALLRKVEDDRDEWHSEVDRSTQQHVAEITRLKGQHAAELKEHKEQKEKLSNQLKSMSLEQSPVIRDLQAQVDTHMQTINNLHDQAASLVNEREKLKAALQEVTRKQENLSLEVERLQKEHATDTARSQRQHTAEIKKKEDQNAEIQAKLDSMSHNKASAISDLQAKIETQGQMIRYFELEKAWLKKDCEKLEASNKSCGADATRSKLEHAKELEECEEKRAAESRKTTAVRDELTVEVGKTRKLRREHVLAVILLKLEHTNELEKRREQQVVALRAVEMERNSLRLEVETLKQQHAAAVECLKVEHAKQLEEHREKQAAEVRKIRVERDKALFDWSQSAKEHVTTVERLKREHANGQESHQKKQREARDKLIVDMGKLKAEHVATVECLNNEHAKKLKQIQERQGAGLRATEAERDASRLEMENLRKEQAKAVQRLKLAHVVDLETHRRKAVDVLKEAKALGEQLLALATNGMREKRDTWEEAKTREQELTIGDLQVKMTAQQKMVTDLEQQKTSLEKDNAKAPLAAFLSSSLRQNAKSPPLQSPASSGITPPNNRKRKASNPPSDQATKKNGGSNGC
ncbi:hypothetical protein QFC21_001352 [Naganishia friedmannii]|uniref:Uncharacterized protein n=1 Tax=Naganishia friedmannii TaxID=89922 RepID=A0ACC2W3C3_9TREE|nr:hypothetical protein QFC21_001352 [Naganishia friedmannii]